MFALTLSSGLVLQMVVYGRRSCPDTWTVEYDGYIMSSAVSQTRLMFECIDSEPEYIEGRRV